MQVIIITSADPVSNEIEVIHDLFKAGLKILHVRKPDFTREEMKAYLKGISHKYRNRLVIHSYHDLARKMRLKGIHKPDTKSNDNWISTLRLKISKLLNSRLQISTTVHNMKSLEGKSLLYDYVIFSP
ncbi:MAG: thiamine phosphate synthase, partial [Bacteroidota bacterium]|nr:thiamine phosphate synthase [Bacteroidota bacterium]